MNLDELRKKFEDGVALQPLWNEDDNLPFDEKSKVYAVMCPMHLSLSTLRYAYEVLCEEYRRRLCEMWETPFDESWWIADKIGEGLFLCDCSIPLDMPMLRYVVENNVPESDWIEWCDFVDSEIFAGHNIPRINFYHYMNGARPEILTK